MNNNLHLVNQGSLNRYELCYVGELDEHADNWQYLTQFETFSFFRRLRKSAR